MDGSSREDIRRLLKTFGVKADEAIMNYLEHMTDERPLHVRLTLEDLTDYGENPPQDTLHLEVEGEIHH